MGSQTKIAWQWAYETQLHLFYAHDAYWIECAKRNWRGKDDLADFNNLLSSYSLKRGILASYFAKEGKVQHFIGRCNHYFSGTISGFTWQEAQDRWDAINVDLKDEMGAIPAAATLKSFWFYRPVQLPMYDTYVKKALAEQMKQRVDRNNYLLVFGKFFEEFALPQIVAAEKQFEHKYISRPRVGDKFLWLLGSPQKEAIIRNFRSAIRNVRQ